MSETLLRLENIAVHYAGVKALDGADVSLDEGEIVALMGPNGAGKSTILKALFGLAALAHGSIFWHEKKITPSADEMIERGIVFVPQGRKIFTSLSVLENLKLGAFWIKSKEEIKRRLSEIFDLFPVLKTKTSKKGRELSGGEQQMLALGRGLMADPKVLLLDEPSLGLSPKFVKEIFTKIREINERHKTTILIVEHNIKSVLDLAHRGYVLDKGKVVDSGESVNLKTSRVMEQVFLGARE